MRKEGGERERERMGGRKGGEGGKGEVGGDRVADGRKMGVEMEIENKARGTMGELIGRVMMMRGKRVYTKSRSPEKFEENEREDQH